MKQTITITNALHADEAAFLNSLKSMRQAPSSQANGAIARQNTMNIVMGMSAAVALTEDNPDETTPSEGEVTGTEK